VKELDSKHVGALFDGYSSRFESELLVDLHDSIKSIWKKMGKKHPQLKTSLIYVHCVDISKRTIEVLAEIMYTHL
jgi:hypothetical protein